jgi:hypothetical protein
MPLRPHLSLDGPWQFWIGTSGALSPSSLDAHPELFVQVPAPLQSQGPALRNYSGPAWYRRTFEIPAAWFGERVIVLGFGAADYFAEVWLNDVKIGEHEGGYLPFEFDVTQVAHPGVNTLTVRITDPTALFPEIPHGKQSWYGPLSGLWQSVWLENRPPTHLLKLRITPNVAREQVEVEAILNQPLSSEQQLSFEILTPEGETCARLESQTPTVSIPVPHPRLWDIDSPNLYTLRVVLSKGGQPSAAMDTLTDAFGFRTIETRNGQILLNGRPVYLRGALDQDYYPDLICTPPSLEYIEDSFRKAKAMGLNCLRVHIKVADPRYYLAADRVGLLIWTEVPNWSRLTADSMRRGRETLEGMIRRDWNHPSIVIWTIINEAWGTELAINPDHCAWLSEMYTWVKSLDPTRLVVDNSACEPGFHVQSDLDDYHFYAAIPEGMRAWDRWIHEFANRAAWIYRPDDPNVEIKNGSAPLLVSEFGNWGLPDIGPLFDYYKGEPWWFETGWDWGTAEVYPHGVERRFEALHLDKLFGDFAGLARAAQWAQFEALKYQIETMRLYPSISGYVITEFTDVHWECNGLLDMLRNPKVFFSQLADLNGDTLLIPRAARRAYWPGEAVTIDVHLSHVSQAPIQNARLEWSVTDTPTPELTGQMAGISVESFDTVRLGRITFTAPSITAPTRARLQLALLNESNCVIARNSLDFRLVPRPSSLTQPLTCPDASLAEKLEHLGYSVTSHSNAITVLTQLDASARRFLQEGGRILFLAETPGALKTKIPRLVLKARRKTVWSDNSAATFTWYRKDRFGSILGTDSGLGLASAAFTPKTVIRLFGTREFESEVLAGMFAGWLHYPVALILKVPVGRGTLLVTTLRLKNQLGTDPVATLLFNELVRELE